MCVTFRGNIYIPTHTQTEAPVPLGSLAFTVNHSRLANFAGSLSVCEIANMYRGGGVVI